MELHPYYTSKEAFARTGQGLGSRARSSSMARMCEHSVERARDATQVKCVCQQCAVANLAPGPRAHEPPQLGMALPCTLGGLVLKAAERLEFALNRKQSLGRGTSRCCVSMRPIQ